MNSSPRHGGAHEQLATVAILTALAFAAYGTSMFHYLPAADDALAVNALRDPRNPFNFRNEGAWRALGGIVACTGLNMPHAIYLGIVIAIHAMNAVLIAGILRQLGVQRALALAPAAIFAVAPAFHEAIVWIAASPVVWSCACFLLTLRLLVDRNLAVKHPGIAAGSCFMLALAGNLFHEQLLFSYLALIPAVAWWSGCGWRPRLPRAKLAMLAAPALGAFLFGFAYLLTLGPGTTKQPGFSLRAAISPWYYQYVNLQAFAVWRDPVWIRQFKQELLGWPGLAGSCCLVAGSLGLARVLSVTGDNSDAAPKVRFPGQVAAGWMAIGFGASAIYSLAGGFSLDSRKRYVFVAILLLAATHLLSTFRPGVRFRSALCFLLVSCALTTITLTRARRELLTAKVLYCQALDDGKIKAPVWLDQWDSSPAAIGRVLWIDIREEMNFHSAPGSSAGSLATSKKMARSVLRYDWERRQWNEIPPAHGP